MKKIVLALSAVILAMIVAAPASAEQGCPPGQIPAASNGAISSCVPIPNERPLVGSEPARWHTRYGAMAFDPASGIVTGSKMKRSAADAVETAMQDCGRGGSGGCKSLGSYSNGCVVALRPKALWVEPLVGYGPSIGQAKAQPARFCSDKSFECEMVYSGCSKASWF